MCKVCELNVFIDDISKLEENCLMKREIKEGLKNQILFQAHQKKEISSDRQFKEYIDSQLRLHSDTMNRVYLTERQNSEYKNDPYRHNRCKIYIWNKESSVK